MCKACSGLPRRERRLRHGSGRTEDPDLAWAKADQLKHGRIRYDHDRYVKSRTLSLQAVAS